MHFKSRFCRLPAEALKEPGALDSGLAARVLHGLIAEYVARRIGRPINVRMSDGAFVKDETVASDQKIDVRRTVRLTRVLERLQGGLSESVQNPHDVA